MLLVNDVFVFLRIQHYFYYKIVPFFHLMRMQLLHIQFSFAACNIESDSIVFPETLVTITNVSELTFFGKR